MKTKLTLFVAVLAVALFGMGCASTSKGPPVPHAVKWNGHWYAVYNDKRVTGTEAEAQCNKLGGYLVVISGKAENEFIEGLASASLKFDQDYFIGLKKTGKLWQWVNGEDFSKGYKNWGPDEFGSKAGRTEVQASMWVWEGDRSEGRRTGQWATIPEHFESYFICEWE